MWPLVHGMFQGMKTPFFISNHHVFMLITHRKAWSSEPRLLYLLILLNAKFSSDFFFPCLMDLFAIIDQLESLGVDF